MEFTDAISIKFPLLRIEYFVEDWDELNGWFRHNISLRYLYF